MKLKKIIIIQEDNNNFFEVCEKCRNKYLGKYDNNGNSITWKKISSGNCYCKLLI